MRRGRINMSFLFTVIVLSFLTCISSHGKLVSHFKMDKDVEGSEDNESSIWDDETHSNQMTSDGHRLQEIYHDVNVERVSDDTASDRNDKISSPILLQQTVPDTDKNGKISSPTLFNETATDTDNDGEITSPTLFNETATDTDNDGEITSPALFNETATDTDNDGKITSPALFNETATDTDNDGEITTPTLFNETATDTDKIAQISSQALLTKAAIESQERSDNTVTNVSKETHQTTGNNRRGHAATDDTRPRILSSDHRDKFRCGPCLCGYDNHKYVKANCTFRYFYRIPQHLPGKTSEIDISNNHLDSFNQTLIAEFDSLQSLKMQRNSIAKFDITSAESNLLSLDLSYNLMEQLEDDCFHFTPLLKKLSFHDNRLTHISNRTFHSLSHLQTLDLSRNHINHIEKSAFHSLVELRELYIYANIYLGYYEHRFPPEIFTNLKKLNTLAIQGNYDGAMHYPIKALEQIKSLQRLNIDIVYSLTFLGPEILNLTRLTTLEFGPHASCHHIKTIPADFFQYVPNIKSLSFNGCHFVKIDPKAFGVIPNLRNLSISFIEAYDLDQAFEDLQGLQNITLHYLRLQHIIGFHKLCYSLTGKHVRYISKLPLIELDISKNRIVLVQTDFIEGLPPTLSTLILAFNLLTLKGDLWRLLYPMKNLEVLDVSYQNYMMDSNTNIDSHQGSDQPYYNDRVDYENRTEDRNPRIISPSFGEDKSVKIFKHNDTSENEKHASTCVEPFSEYGRIGKKFGLPQKLRYLKASHYSFFGQFIFERKIKYGNHLKYLLFDNSHLTHWGDGRVPLSVKHLDLRNNYCHHIQSDFFRKNNSLCYISLSSNFLGPNFAIPDGRHYFTYLDKTRHLDLSLNFIYRIPFSFLKGLLKLDTLRLTDNRLQYINLNVTETPELKMLDLRRNSISWISKQTREDLDNIALRHPITIALLHNPISCTCEGIEMIKWLAMTNVHLLDRDLLECNDESGKTHLMGDISLLHAVLQRRCTNTKAFILPSAICISLFICIVAGYYIGKRYRWWFYVKYKKNVWIAKWFGFKSKIAKDPTKVFKYDAYICYSDEDRDLAIECANTLCRHQLFIPDRDILYGTSEISGMMSGITNSHKFLIFLTDNFKEDLSTDFRDNGMLEYTINMALFEERFTRRKFLHVMKFTDTEGIQMPLYLADVLQDHERRTTFPGDDPYASSESVQCAWNSLSTCIDQRDDSRDEIIEMQQRITTGTYNVQNE